MEVMGIYRFEARLEVRPYIKLLEVGIFEQLIESKEEQSALVGSIHYLSDVSHHIYGSDQHICSSAGNPKRIRF
jgi:hypothetical protein